MIKEKLYILVKAAYAAIGYYPVTLFGHRLRLDPSRMEFWRSLRRGYWEPETVFLLERVVRRTDVYCDIGAWIGPTVLCAALRCKTVYCFEPDRFAYESLLMNIRLNGMTNVIPFHVALGDTDGLIDMASHGDLGDTMTSFLAETAGKQTVTVPCMAWDTFLRQLHPERMDVIKMDVEGAEFNLIPAMHEYIAKYRPTLYLSTHAPYLPAADRRQQLQRLADVVSVYDRCCTSDMKLATHDVLYSTEAVDGYPAFLFFDSAQRPDLL